MYLLLNVIFQSNCSPFRNMFVGIFFSSDATNSFSNLAKHLRYTLYRVNFLLSLLDISHWLYGTTLHL